MSAPTTLPACAKNHPNVSSLIKVNLVQRENGTAYERSVCVTCRSVAALAQRREGMVFGKSARVPDYGVQRLDWVPPERMLEQHND